MSEEQKKSDLSEWGEVAAEIERKNRRQAGEIRELKAKLGILQDQIDIAEHRVDIVLGISEHQEVEGIKARKRGRHEAAAMLVASDWHVGELVDPVTVNNVNEYTPDIAKRRAVKFFENGFRLIDIQRAAVTVEQVCLALLGDLITGYIHEELMETNPLTPMEEVLLAQELLISGIDYLLTDKKLRKLYVPCCHGNHGRTSKRIKYSASAKNNYEWLMYHNLKNHYSGEKRIKFDIADGRQLYSNIFESKFRFHHGDDLRYQGGIGGISIGGRKAVDAWDQQQKVDYTLMGHWHQLVDFGWLTINGSLIGFNPFAQAIKARYEPPRQIFTLIDKEYGKTMFCPIMVE